MHETQLAHTSLYQHIALAPTRDKTRSAMSAFRFRLLPHIENRILPTLWSVFRQGRSYDDCDQDNEVGVLSAPHYVHVASLLYHFSALLQTH